MESAAYVLVLFAAVIALMIVMISKWNIHASVSILIASLVLAIGLGTPWEKIEGIVNSGFSGTIKGISKNSSNFPNQMVK